MKTSNGLTEPRTICVGLSLRSILARIGTFRKLQKEHLRKIAGVRKRFHNVCRTGLIRRSKSDGENENRAVKPGSANRVTVKSSVGIPCSARRPLCYP